MHGFFYTYGRKIHGTFAKRHIPFWRRECGPQMWYGIFDRRRKFEINMSKFSVSDGSIHFTAISNLIYVLELDVKWYAFHKKMKNNICTPQIILGLFDENNVVVQGQLWESMGGLWCYQIISICLNIGQIQGNTLWTTYQLFLLKMSLTPYVVNPNEHIEQTPTSRAQINDRIGPSFYEFVYWSNQVVWIKLLRTLSPATP